MIIGLGTYTNEDCMELMARYPDKHFDLAIVDPPYGIKRFEKPSGKTRFKTSQEFQTTGIKWDCELDKDYYNASVERLRKHLAQEKLFVKKVSNEQVQPGMFT